MANQDGTTPRDWPPGPVCKGHVDEGVASPDKGPVFRKKLQHGNAGQSKFFLLELVALRFAISATAKRNNGHRRRSTAAACNFVRTKVKEK